MTLDEWKRAQARQQDEPQFNVRKPQGPKGLTLERIDVPDPAPGDALIRVHAAAITRDELDWPADRLPATPSYELSGVVTAVAPDVEARRCPRHPVEPAPGRRTARSLEHALEGLL